MTVVGTMLVEFRGSLQSVTYRRTDDDCEFWFADEYMNDLPLTPQERRAIRREIVGGENA